jgi:hypothetical protein
MEDVFVVHQPKMDIRQVTLLSEAYDRITFAVHDAWHGKERPEEVFASKVLARKVDGQWKLDSESVHDRVQMLIEGFTGIALSAKKSPLQPSRSSSYSRARSRVSSAVTCPTS